VTVFDNLNTLSSPFESAVALGYFDGMHLAHREIINNVLYKSKRFIPTVFTFTLCDGQNKGDGVQKPIMSVSQRVEEIEKMGIQQLFIPTFDEIKDLTAEEFFYDVLLDKMKAKTLACGYNFRFGKGNLGDVAVLKRLCEKEGIELFVADEMTFKGKTLSSTYIRECLKNGDIENANLMLGAPYTITGEVIHGAHLGSKLNFPTINQLLDTQKMQVKYGVYLSEVLVDNNTYPAVTNVGVKPTVNGNVPMAESHLIDFTGNLYGKYAAVKLINFLREETRFESLNELKTAVQNDINKAKQLFKTAN
jgi:riboflavin kinase/FMN adenylyltransferase